MSTYLHTTPDSHLKSQSVRGKIHTPNQQHFFVSTSYIISFLNGLLLFQTAISIPTPAFDIQIGLLCPILTLLAYPFKRGLIAVGAIVSLSALVVIVSILANSFDLKYAYFVLANGSMVALAAIISKNHHTMKGFVDGAIYGVLLSSFIGFLLCSTGGCGFGNDTNFSLAENPNRLYGFNAESSILAPQLIAVCAILTLRARKTLNPKYLILLAFAVISIFFTKSSQSGVLPVFILAAMVSKIGKPNLKLQVIFLSLAGFILALPLLMTAIEIFSRNIGHMEVFGRELHRDIIASSRIRFASVLAGWSVIVEAPFFGAGFTKSEVIQKIYLQLGNYDKGGVDNFLVARTVEFGVIYAFAWLAGAIKIVRILRAGTTSYCTEILLMFSILSIMSLSSTGYLGIYYYALPLAFVIPSISERFKKRSHG